MIEAHEITKSFAQVRAVHRLSLRVGAGEVVGLLGPNGAGKTTALRMLAGLLRPSSGEARICGLDLRRNPIAAKRRLGFLTSTTGLYDRLTAREVLSIFAALNGLDRAQTDVRISALADELDLGEALLRRCSTLSTGQKQRVSIARAAIHDPDVYILDEPTAALDPLASQAVLQLVRRAQARGKAVLFSTHRMEEAEYLCQRLYFVRRGEVVAEGDARALCQRSGEQSLTGAFLHYANGGAMVQEGQSR